MAYRPTPQQYQPFVGGVKQGGCNPCEESLLVRMKKYCVRASQPPVCQPRTCGVTPPCFTTGVVVQPVCQQPPPPPAIIPANRTCIPDPNPKCLTVYPVVRKMPSDLSGYLPLRAVCPTFEGLFRYNILHLVLFAWQTRSRDSKMLEATRKELHENAVKWTLLLGPTWLPVFENYIAVILDAITAYLGEGDDGSRQKLLENSLKQLQNNHLTMALYFQSMPQLACSEDRRCCIANLWKRYVDDSVDMARALQENPNDAGKDPAAFNEVVWKVIENAAEFGKYLDSLCLKPLAQCAGVYDNPIYDGQDRVSNNVQASGIPASPLRQQTPPTAMGTNNGSPNYPQTTPASAGGGAEDDDYDSEDESDDDQPTNNTTTNTTGNRVPLTTNQPQPPQRVGSSLLSWSSGVNNNSAKIGVDVAGENVAIFRKSEQIPAYYYFSSFINPIGKQTRTGVPPPVIFASADTLSASVVTLDMNAPTKRIKIDVLDQTKTDLQVGTYKFNPLSDGDPSSEVGGTIAALALNSWSGKSLFYIHGDAKLDFSTTFTIEWKTHLGKDGKELTKDQGRVTVPTSDGTGDNFTIKKANFDVKGTIPKLTPITATGVWTLPEQTQKGKKFFVQLSIVPVSASAELAGRGDTNYYAINNVSICFPDLPERSSPSS